MRLSLIPVLALILSGLASIQAKDLNFHYKDTFSNTDGHTLIRARCVKWVSIASKELPDDKNHTPYSVIEIGVDGGKLIIEPKGIPVDDKSAVGRIVQKTVTPINYWVDVINKTLSEKDKLEDEDLFNVVKCIQRKPIIEKKKNPSAFDVQEYYNGLVEVEAAGSDLICFSANLNASEVSKSP